MKGRALSVSEFARKLKGEPNDLKRKMLLLGYLSAGVSKNGGAVFLVGGQAVETYTGGVFTTGDIDMTTTDRKGTEALLSKLGFSKEGIIWLNPRLGLAVHVVSDYPTRTFRARTIDVEGYQVRVVGVEDLIVDRLAAAKFWKSERDGEQARALLSSFKDSIYYEYLKKTAEKEMVGDYLKGLKEKMARRRRVTH